MERTRGYLILIKMSNATATWATEGFSAALNRMPLAVHNSMPHDQGPEFAKHAELIQKTGSEIYFCDSHSPWQSSTNENINDLIRQYVPKVIRQYVPKGTDLSKQSQKKLDAISY